VDLCGSYNAEERPSNANINSSLLSIQIHISQFFSDASPFKYFIPHSLSICLTILLLKILPVRLVVTKRVAREVEVSDLRHILLQTVHLLQLLDLHHGLQGIASSDE